MNTSIQDSPNQVLTAIQLGWLTVEVFGRIRRWKRRPTITTSKSVATSRFTFSDWNPNLYVQLLISLYQLKVLAAQLVPDQPPPVPDDPMVLLVKVKEDKQYINRLWGEFETWSREVWNTLQNRGSLIGRAFTCGGHLADTYWYPQGVGAGKLAEMLRSYRLGYVTERVDDLADHLPEHVALVIHYSLELWSIGEAVKGMDEDGQKRTLKRLESQIKVWHDLLFGLRQAGSYLVPKDSRLITWGAIGATFLLVVLVGLAVWMVVLLLSSAGRALLATNSGLSAQATEASSDLVAQLLNWQNWSALLATLSAVVVVLTGFITRLSGWMIVFYKNVKNWLELRRIYKRTYRSWEFRKDLQAVEVGLN